jgi:ABC-type sulfate transport system permease subunit
VRRHAERESRSYMKLLLLAAAIGLVTVVITFGFISALPLATMKAPFFAILLTLILVPREAAPVIAIAVIVGWFATTRFSMIPAPAVRPTETVVGEGEGDAFPVKAS